MSEPTEKDRETARQIGSIIDDATPAMREGWLASKAELVESIAQALADAYARGRADAKAEDAEIARISAVPEYSTVDVAKNLTAQSIYDAILAPSSGPTYEQRIRAEIAEKVGGLRGVRSRNERGMIIDDERDYVCREDVIAAINGGEK